MAINPYFNHNPQGTDNSNGEQHLIDALTQEFIQSYGLEVYYCPRKINQLDGLFGEGIETVFDKATPIEMYLQSTEGWEGDGALISKFGLELRQGATFVVSKTRFITETDKPRPLEGDLIYLPMTKSLFVIKYCDYENPFYQLGKLYSFKLTVELYEYDAKSGFATGIADIDAVVGDAGNVIAVVLYPLGAGSFVAGDKVYQGDPNSPTSTGTVKIWDRDTNTLFIQTPIGSWTGDRVLSDHTDGRTQTNFPVLSTNDNNVNDQFSDAENIDLEKDDVINFSEQHPFGDLGDT